MSPFLRDQNHNRTVSEVHVENLRKTDTYFVLDTEKGRGLFREAVDGQSLGDVVRAIATGQYDDLHGNGPVAVVRASLADNEFENYTARAALQVASYITSKADSPEDPLWNCPFLDNAWPGWKLSCWREWQAEEGYQKDYQDEKRFHAGYGR